MICFHRWNHFDGQNERNSDKEDTTDDQDATESDGVSHG